MVKVFSKNALPRFSKFVKTCKLVLAKECDCDPTNNAYALFYYFTNRKRYWFFTNNKIIFERIACAIFCEIQLKYAMHNEW